MRKTGDEAITFPGERLFNERRVFDFHRILFDLPYCQSLLGEKKLQLSYDFRSSPYKKSPGSCQGIFSWIGVIPLSRA